MSGATASAAAPDADRLEMRQSRALQPTLSVESAAPSPLAGHALNPSLGLGGGIHAATRSRNRRGHRTRQLVGARSESCFSCGVHQTCNRCFMIERDASSTALPCTPTILTGPCPLTVAGPYAAWMPRKSLHGRTCGVSRDGGRARALQPTRSVESAAPSPLAGHALNPSLGTRWRHPRRHTVPQPARTPHQTVGRRSFGKLFFVRRASDVQPMLHDRTIRIQHCSSMHTDHLDGSLPAHRRGTLRGMDAA
ncbi:hypothetical protein CPBF426_28280 [Xanthomonas arboricola pv. juglandis]|nr:hypothetical protein CPBF426_28280 [Xanthomonas arboricola pv. juglandis]